MDTPTTFREKRTLSLPRYYDEATLANLDAVPDIAKPYRAKAILGLAILSGVLSLFSIWLWPREGYGFWLGPGVLFGVLVLLPWCRFCQITWGQTVGVVLLSPAGYAAAVYVFCLGYFPLAGLAGCAITFAPLLIGCHRRIAQAVIIACVTGCLIGWSFAVWYFALFGGIAVWQIAVAYCLSVALKTDDA